MFTDLHLGKKGNSDTHNQDVIDFIEWAMEIGKEQHCSHLVFLGDWHDDRTRLDARTLNYSQSALEYIDSQDWLQHAWFLIGNHDLFYRHKRDVHSLPHTNPLQKIELIQEPKEEDDFLFLPFLFDEEYDKHLKESKAKYVFGHLEFKDFIVTGSNYRMESGPDASQYKKPDFIMSGHFHKRQSKNNIVYIGNGFPMDFGDAGDTQRGVAILDTRESGDERLNFIDWEESPSYVKCLLSETLQDPDKFLKPKSRVKCLMDIDVSYDEASYIRDKFTEDYGLREFQLEDPQVEDLKAALTDDDKAAKEIEIGNMDQTILEMLSEVSAPNIDNDKLKDIYRGL